MTLLLSGKHGGMTPITRILPLKDIGSLEEKGEVGRVGELLSVSKWIDCEELPLRNRKRLRACGLELGMGLTKASW